MPQRYSPRSARAALALHLILTVLIAGAALGRLLLPPGTMGRGPELGLAGAQVRAVAAAARSLSPNRPAEQLAIGHTQIRGDLPSSALFPYSTAPRMGNPAGGAHSVAGRPLREQKHDWRLELQVSLSWQYADGASSRALHAPVSPPIGTPWNSGRPLEHRQVRAAAQPDGEAAITARSGRLPACNSG